MKIVKDFLISAIVTCFFVGRAPFAPGTFGSICTFPIYFGICYLLGGDSYFIAGAICLLFIVGVIFSSLYISNIENKDPKEVVIDEVVGQMLVIYFCNANFLYNYMLAFLLFRFFDIYKPWPISFVDKNIKSGLGIMLDDILAAIFASAVLCVIEVL